MDVNNAVVSLPFLRGNCWRILGSQEVVAKACVLAEPVGRISNGDTIDRLGKLWGEGLYIRLNPRRASLNRE